jgi:hypothetical protein
MPVAKLKMGQKELDRYNIKRGGTAGMSTLIPKGGAVSNASPSGAPLSGAAAAGSFDFSPQGIMSQYQQAYNAANSANLGRYNDILQGYTDRYDRNMRTLDGMSSQQKADINENYNGQGANERQRLADLGMSGTTIAPTMAAGIERNRIADQNRLADQVAQQRIGLDSGLSGDRLGFMERRTDQLPDIGMYANLAMQAAAGGIGGGPGGPGGGVPGGAPGAAGGPVGMVQDSKPFRAQAGSGMTENPTFMRPYNQQEQWLAKIGMGNFIPGYQGATLGHPALQAAQPGGMGAALPATPATAYQPAPALSSRGLSPTMAPSPMGGMARGRGLYGAMAKQY